jgi:glycosyltransferase involved in cell wall biosynthesis
MNILLFTSSLIALIIAINAAINRYSRPTLSRSKRKNAPPSLVSVLIPARNEAENIAETLRSLTSQSYHELEIFVLDDESTDLTPKIIDHYAKEDRRIEKLKGSALPPNWLGKNWACHQLSQAAKGEFLLFIDADVRLAPEAVESALETLQSNQVGLLSVFSTQIMNTSGERLVVPLLNWILLSFLPLKAVSIFSDPRVIAANGQFLFFERKIYDKIGGHEVVQNNVVEDMELARHVKRAGEKVLPLLGGELVHCRMYRGLRDAIAGFTKNFYPGTGLSSPLFILFIFIALLTLAGPFLFVWVEAYFLIPCVIILLNRHWVSKTSSQSSLFNLLTHPLQMLLLTSIGIRSVVHHVQGRAQWKGRIVSQNR